MLWLLTELMDFYQPSARVVLANIGPRLWQYGQSTASSVQKRPRANIPKCGSSKLTKGFIIWYSGHACFKFEGLQKQKHTTLLKRSLWGNPDREKKKQSQRWNLPQDYLAVKKTKTIPRK